MRTIRIIRPIRTLRIVGPARLALAVFLAGGMANVARADRFQRGQLVFNAYCTNCHDVGFKSARNDSTRVDLTRAIDHLNDEELRRFIAVPHRAREATECVHQTLEAQQVEDLVSFLHTRAAAPPTPPRTPRRSNNPLTVIPGKARLAPNLGHGTERGGGK